ncbi:MAG: hypothetical protein KF760_25940 [Candidatus Eremiobacteraeota bacterium]|nr:hypothetical protein [Candidatus Eremiobacteraeota bacterium]MCW5869118.1 hypothetical protein [Candidatus Eremiobacteraeota bacterium]
MRRIMMSAFVLGCLAVPGWSQGAEADTSTTKPTTEKRSSDVEDVEFIDSREAYWVNKGFNDMLYYNGGGTPNSVRAERDKFRADEALSKITKPMVVEVKVSGKTEAQSIPPLKIGGKEEKLP